MQRTDYPATGAWSAAQPAGRRQFVSLGARPIALDVGVTLRDVTIAYETWGTLNNDASNAILVCHAWT
ncbi:MAG: homoserine O-acetyltransferase, partial [Actinomycetota bacterium]